MSSLLDVSFTRKFVKQFRKLPAKNQQQFEDRLEVFLNDQHHSLLRRHPLKGKYAGYYSIDISGDLRALFRHQTEGAIVFSLIGTHSQLY